MKYFAIHLKDKRLARGWDQETIAHMAGVSVRTIQRIEAGSSCSLETLKSLSAAMELQHFSELLPKPDKNEYQPDKWDFIGVLARETLWLGPYRTMMISMVMIGLLTTFFVIDKAKHVPLSYEEQLEIALERNELAKEGEHALYKLLEHKSDAEIEEMVKAQMEYERRAFTTEEWQRLLDAINKTLLGAMIVALGFGLYRAMSSFECDCVVVKPLKEKLGF